MSDKRLSVTGWALVIWMVFSGCSASTVYNPSLMELNEKAKQLLAAGDVDAAIGRLESAHELNPSEPTTLYNLGIAYATKGESDKAIEIDEQLLSLHPANKSQVEEALGIAYENKGDALLDRFSKSAGAPGKTRKASKAAASHEPPATLKQEAIGVYQKAIDQFNGAQTDAGKPVPDLAAHIRDLEDKIKKLNS